MPSSQGAEVSYLTGVEVGEGFGPFAFLRETFGFVPNIFRAQTLLPRAIEAELPIVQAVLLREGALSRLQKELMLLNVAAAHQSRYCVGTHYEVLRSLGIPKQKLDQVLLGDGDLAESDRTLLHFGLTLGQDPRSVNANDIERLRASGFSDEHVLEAVLTVALARFQCTLSVGLGVTPDFEPLEIPRVRFRPSPPAPEKPSRVPRPFIRTRDLSAHSFAPFAFFKEAFGFIPNMFRAQTLRPDFIEAQANAVRTVLLLDDVLLRVQKENILLVISAANLNTYCVAVHCELLRALGISVEKSEQIAVDHRQANLPAPEEALLDFSLKLAGRPAEYGIVDIERLREHGFSDRKILESMVMCAFAHFLITANMGLGAEPDFDPPPAFASGRVCEVNLSCVSERPIAEAESPVLGSTAEVDPDSDLVRRVQRGEREAFEELVGRHGRRIYRTLAGILGQAEEAKDAVQEVFMNAFRNIGGFEGRSKFSTWLMRIAVNRGLQRLRNRRTVESIDSVAGEEAFRPRMVQPWQEDPEQIYSRVEIRQLIERELLKLPVPYRLVVMLRDVQELSTEEAAVALGIGVPGLKTRLLRGRLMLREALAPYFSKPAARRSHA